MSLNNKYTQLMSKATDKELVNIVHICTVDYQHEAVDAGADVVMGGVGFIPVYGWMVSGGYFILKPLVKRHTEIVIKSQIEMGIVGLSSTMPFK